MKGAFILPFCIVRWTVHSGDVNALIRTPRINGDGNYVCTSEEEVFYAISPMQIPVPVGMSVFCALRNLEFPYGTKYIKWVYDTFNLKNEVMTNCTLFSAYTHPGPGLVPLYIYENSHSAIPSFSSTPPSSRWTHSSNSPIYVMTPASVGVAIGDINSLRFRCVEGRCLPDVAELSGVYLSSSESVPFSECIPMCNEFVDNHGFSPTNTWQQLSESDREYSEGEQVQKDKGNRSYRYLILVLVSIVIALLLICIIDFLNRKKESL